MWPPWPRSVCFLIGCPLTCCPIISPQRPWGLLTCLRWEKWFMLEGQGAAEGMPASSQTRHCFTARQSPSRSHPERGFPTQSIYVLSATLHAPQGLMGCERGPGVSHLVFSCTNTAHFLLHSGSKFRPSKIAGAARWQQGLHKSKERHPAPSSLTPNTFKGFIFSAPT